MLCSTRIRRAMLAAAFVLLCAPGGAAVAACGDGVLDAGEQCDHGAANGTDGCCDATCALVDIDVDGICDANDGCRNDVFGARIKESRLTLARLATPPGDDRLRFTGTTTLRFDPEIDPSRDGFRVSLWGVDAGVYREGTTILDAPIPGGGGWSSIGLGAWTYRDPAGSVAGITRVTVKLLAPLIPSPNLIDVAFLVQGRRGIYPATPAMTTSSIVNGTDITGGALWAQVAFGPPASGQCAIAVFTTILQNTCRATLRGRSLFCHGPLPVGPCHIGDPDDLVICDILNAVRAQETYFAAHGAYFSGSCDALPGFTASPGVFCATVGSLGAYLIDASHPNATRTCDWQSSEPAGQNLICF